MGKFAPTNQTVEELIDGLKSQKKKEDAWKLVELCKRISRMDPIVWYPGIIGFGQYHYHYETGIEGDAPYLAFAPRQARISLYIDQDLPEREECFPVWGSISKQSDAFMSINLRMWTLLSWKRFLKNSLISFKQTNWIKVSR